jgi:two-component sensor histidine kinase
MANEKILIVEDEELVAQDIKGTLEDLGYEVSAITPSGEEALEKIKKIQPDSVLMDIMLEGEMDGIETAQKILDLFDIPVVYITAYSNPEILQRAKKTEPYGYILKPFHERDLQINIEMALYKHEARKNRSQLLEQKALNKSLEKAINEKDALLREIHHRVKNNLQIIISLLSLQSKYFDDERIHNFFKDYVNQVKSMAMIHEKMYQSQDLSSIDFNNYLQGLVSQLSSSYKKDPKINVFIDSEDVSLNVETAIPCGLIINELLTNSLKHAFPYSRRGEIRVELNSDSENKFTIIISDDGVGIPEDIEFPDNGSFGFRMVDSLVKQIGGTLKLDKEDGTCYIIEFEELNYNERIAVNNSDNN